jgi:hypothetical protein
VQLSLPNWLFVIGSRRERGRLGKLAAWQEDLEWPGLFFYQQFCQVGDVLVCWPHGLDNSLIETLFM